MDTANSIISSNSFLKNKGKFPCIVNLDTNGQFENLAASSQEKE
jgi:hypothetical protein